MKTEQLNLKKVRKAKGVTQVELAKLSGLSASFITKLERGVDMTFTEIAVQKLARALGVSPEELYVKDEAL